jgi:hypothetical protein
MLSSNGLLHVLGLTIALVAIASSRSIAQVSSVRTWDVNGVTLGSPFRTSAATLKQSDRYMQTTISSYRLQTGSAGTTNTGYTSPPFDFGSTSRDDAGQAANGFEDQVHIINDVSTNNVAMIFREMTFNGNTHRPLMSTFVNALFAKYGKPLKTWLTGETMAEYVWAEPGTDFAAAPDQFISTPVLACMALPNKTEAYSVYNNAFEEYEPPSGLTCGRRFMVIDVGGEENGNGAIEISLMRQFVVDYERLLASNAHITHILESGSAKDQQLRSKATAPPL